MLQENRYVNSAWCLLLSLYPIVVIGTSYLVEPSTYMLVVLIAMPVVLIYLDKRELKNKGYYAPTWLWVLFTPGYIYSRGVITPQYKYFKSVGLASAALIVVVQAVELFGGPAGDSADAKQAYCKSVTEIYQEDKRDTHCLAVHFVSKVEGNNYRGIAQLDNGEDVYFTASWSDNETYELTLRRGFKL